MTSSLSLLEQSHPLQSKSSPFSEAEPKFLAFSQHVSQDAGDALFSVGTGLGAGLGAGVGGGVGAGEGDFVVSGDSEVKGGVELVSEFDVGDAVGTKVISLDELVDVFIVVVV